MKKNSFLPIYILVIAVFITFTAASILSVGMSESDNNRKVNILLAARIYDIIGNDLYKAITVSKTMSNNSFLIDTLQRENTYPRDEFDSVITNYLNNVKNSMNYATAFLISDKTKRYYTYEGLHLIINPEKNQRDFWYSNFLKKRKKYDLNVHIAKQNHDAWTIFVNTLMTDEKEIPIGVCGVGVDMSTILNELKRFGRNYDVKIYLTNKDGVVMVDLTEENIGKKEIKIPEEFPESHSDYVYEPGRFGHFKIIKYIEDLDWYLVVKSSDNGYFRGAFLSTALMHALLCIVMLVIIFKAMQYASENTKKLHTASFVDGPTGLFNKRAFEDFKEHMKQVKIPIYFTVMTADLNGLKRINDTLGHEAGDELIASGGRALQSVIEDYGAVYRTGGDEFIGVFNIPPDELQSIKDKIAEKTAAHKGKYVNAISISLGFATRSENPELSLDELIKLSDERMYADKEAYYERTGSRR